MTTIKAPLMFIATAITAIALFAASGLVEAAADTTAPAAALDPTAVTTIFLIRHAEKEMDQGSDPELTATGQRRSLRWADVFSNQSFDSIYSTNTKRTLSTAAGVASAQNKQVLLTAATPEDLDTFGLRHEGQTVLVVGHSNTITTWVNTLISEDRYTELDESNYSSLFIVTITSSSATVQLLKISL